MKNFLLYLWQLPQNILGFLYFHYKKIDKEYIEDYKGEKILFSSVMKGGISLGKYIVVNSRQHDKYWYNKDSVKHEYGHSVQSRILGWLYLIIIGIPSIIWAGLCTFVCKNAVYYKFYTEKWADKLGGVIR